MRESTRAYFRSASGRVQHFRSRPAPRKSRAPTKYPAQFATWPELVAAELERRERETPTVADPQQAARAGKETAF